MKVNVPQATLGQFIDFNSRNLSRIYPKGSRLLSSNLGEFSLLALINISEILDSHDVLSTNTYWDKTSCHFCSYFQEGWNSSIFSKSAFHPFVCRPVTNVGGRVSHGGSQFSRGNMENHLRETTKIVKNLFLWSLHVWKLLWLVADYLWHQADRSNMYNRAKFLQNGNCGFLLKPKFMSGQLINRIRREAQNVGNKNHFSDASTYSLSSSEWLSRIPGRKVAGT